MRARRLLPALVVLGASTPAAADLEASAPCAEHIDDPVTLPWRDSGIDGGRGGCLHADVAVRLGARALVDTPDFYGTLGGDATVQIRLLEEWGLEWGFSLRAIDAVFVQNAVLAVDELGYGPLGAHVAWGGDGVLAGRPFVRALHARVEVPFTRSRLDSSSGGLLVGAGVTWLLAPRVRLHGHAGALGWYASSTSGRTGRAAAQASVDLTARPVRWLALFAGADVQAGWYGWGLDHLALRGGGHWRVKGLWRVELAAGLPVAGAERMDVAGVLSVRRDLD